MKDTPDETQKSRKFDKFLQKSFVNRVRELTKALTGKGLRQINSLEKKTYQKTKI